MPHRPGRGTGTASDRPRVYLPTMSSQSGALIREDVTFPSHGERCAGWLWRGQSGTPGPTIVLGHGFSATKEARLDAYGDHFAEAGYSALAFDYRHFGASSGEPRELLDIGMQLEDWGAAIAYARSLPETDPDRIVLWGTSFAGGHVLAAAAGDRRVAAVISQAPHVDGPATMKAMKPWIAAGAVAIGWADRIKARLGGAPIYVPRKGGDTREGLGRLYPPGHQQRPQVSARVFSHIPRYSPGSRAADIACPLLVQVTEHDAITPPGPALEAAANAPLGEAKSYPLSHFEIYLGAPFERAVADQLEFLERALSRG